MRHPAQHPDFVVVQGVALVVPGAVCIKFDKAFWFVETCENGAGYLEAVGFVGAPAVIGLADFQRLEGKTMWWPPSPTQSVKIGCSMPTF